MPYTKNLGVNVPLATQTLKKMQHLLGEEKGPFSFPDKIK